MKQRKKVKMIDGFAYVMGSRDDMPKDIWYVCLHSDGSLGRYNSNAFDCFSRECPPNKTPIAYRLVSRMLQRYDHDMNMMIWKLSA